MTARLTDTKEALTIGTILRVLREQKGITARALSLAAGLSESYVGKVEKGSMEPSLRAFGKIAKQLGLTPREVYLLAMQEAERV
jgi:transcriptional regulator with XRE-family HTH domain